jgi:hypothetical protein
MINFTGPGTPFDNDAVDEATRRLEVSTAELWAVLTVETRGCGFLSDRRPTILFERHVFHRETNGRFDAAAPDISSPDSGGYGATGAHQYERLQEAMKRDERAAMRSTSWGIGQVMGFNAQSAGYADVEAMVTAMVASEAEQLRAMVGEIVHNKLHLALRSHNWPAFARGYNGPAYAKNKYDVRLASAYVKFVTGPLPDLTVRAAQAYLTYLGYHPGPVDGLLGRFTRSALNEFQAKQGLTVTDRVTERTLSILKDKVAQLPD